MLPMPRTALRRRVPLLGEWSNTIGVLSRPLAALVVHMFPDMFGSRQAFEVAHIVVEGVAIPVMYMPPVWNGTVRGLPNLDVKVANALAAVRDMRSEVNAIRSLIRVRISTESDPLKVDHRDPRHNSIVSPYRTASRRQTNCRESR